MNMKTNFRRLLSFIIAMAMIVTMLPVSAYAEETPAADVMIEEYADDVTENSNAAENEIVEEAAEVPEEAETDAAAAAKEPAIEEGPAEEAGEELTAREEILSATVKGTATEEGMLFDAHLTGVSVSALAPIKKTPAGSYMTADIVDVSAYAEAAAAKYYGMAASDLYGLELHFYNKKGKEIKSISKSTITMTLEDVTESAYYIGRVSGDTVAGSKKAAEPTFTVTASYAYTYILASLVDDGVSRSVSKAKSGKHSFRLDDGDVDIAVTTPKGAFSGTVAMEASEVDTEDVQDTVDETLGDEAGEVLGAYDISFYNNANGTELQPKKDVTVTINTPLDMEKTYSLVHIGDDGRASVVEGAVFSESGVKYTAGAFSVYAIVDSGNTATGEFRATYKFTNENGEGSFNFYNTDGEYVDNQIIKDQEVLLDVGLPDIGSNQKFIGWYIYDTATNSYTDQKIEFDTPISVNKTETITVAPKYDSACIVTFYVKENGAEDNDVFTKKQVVVTSGSAAQLDVSRLIAPSPASGNVVKTFTNWAYADGTNVTDGTITVTGDMDMYPVFRDAHWIRFVGGPVGSGATYTEPICVYADERICDVEKPANPTREGYTFDNWYTQETGGSLFDWTSTAYLTEDVTLYAHWNGKSVNYTVIYWYENPDDDGYSYGSSVTRSGTAGQMTNAATSSSTNRQGFTAQTIEQKVINGDGTTIVNVYYKRNVYEVKFYRYTYTYTPTTSNSGTQYGLVDGAYVALTRRGRSGSYYWTYGNNVTYTGTRYTRSSGQSWQEISELTISAKYGEMISHLWPSRRTDLSEQYPLSWKVSPNGNTYQTNIVTMPINGASFYYEALSGRYTIRAAYYTQNINGVGYSLDHNDDDRGDSTAWYITQEEFYDIPGFTPNYDMSSPLNSNPEWVGGQIYAWTLYYNRNQYDIVFNRNGGPSVSNVEDVYYQADISGYSPPSYVVGETTKQSGSELLYFAGWYDNEALAGEPFEFNGKTMPAHNIILYAKWEPAWYTVVIDPDNGELAEGDSTFFFKKSGDTFNAYGATRDYVESASGTFYYHYDAYDETDPPEERRAYYGTDGSISTDGGKKYVQEANAYTLSGWFEIKDGVMSSTPYDFAEGITHDVYLKAKWRRSGTYTVVYDAVVVQDGIEIAGTDAPDDSTKYADQSESVILGKPTAPEKYTFMGWKLGDTLYKPGDTFTVDAALADQYKVIHLTAVYQAAGDSVIGLTHIYWYANNGTDDVVKQENLQYNAPVDIQPQDTFSYPGYDFIGWAKQADAGPDDLFLKYEDGVFKAKNGEGEWVTVTKVGADETLPYDDLYAIWKKQCFYILHSSSGELQAVEMTNSVDLTEYVAGGTLYGGYYSSYGAYQVTDANKKDARAAASRKVTVTEKTYNGTSLYCEGTTRYWTKTDAGTVSGKTLEPTAGAVYYLKEVPTCYLKTNARWVYDWADDYKIKELYLLTGIDDTYYTEVGYIVIKTDEKGKVVSKFSYQQRNSDEVTTVTAASLIGQRGYLGVVNAEAYIGTLKGGASVVVKPYWKTLDGVQISTSGYTLKKEGDDAELTKNNLKYTAN